MYPRDKYLKKIIELIDKTPGVDAKLQFVLAYPKYAKEIVEYICS